MTNTTSNSSTDIDALRIKLEKLQKENSEFSQKIQQLERSNLVSQHYLDIAGTIILALNVKGEITRANKKACEVLGYTKEGDIIGMNWFQNFLPQNQITEVQEVFSKLIEGKVENVKYHENSIIAKGGKQRIVYWHNSILMDESGKVSGLISSGLDITEKKEAEIELKLSQNRLKTLSEASFESIFISDKGICLDQNKTAETMFGYSLEEAVGKPGTNWIIPEDRDKVMHNMMNSVTDPYEVTALRKDGSIFPCEIQARVLDIDGKKVRFTALRDITDRKEAERKINQSEQKYKALFENIQEAVALHEMIFDENDKPIDFIWLDVNPNYEEITKLKKENIIGKRGMKVIPSIEQRWLDAYGEVVKTGKSVTIIDHSEYLDKYWEVKAFRPAPNQFGTAMVDITERKKAEIERERIFSLSVDMVCTATFDGYLKQINPAWENILGWTEEELKSKPFIEFLHPDDVERTIEAASGISAGENILGFENRYQTKDGKYKWLSWNTISIPEEKIMLGIARDISQEKQTRKILVETKDRLEKALKIGNAGVYQWNLVTNELDMSDELLDIFGFNKKDGIPDLDPEGKYVYAEDRELLKNTIMDGINIGTSFQLDYRFYKADTMELRWAHVEASVEYLDDKPVSMIGMVQDITDIKNVEKELTRAKDKAEESDRLKTAFLANMSHEIRTPMNGILGFTELLKEPNLSGDKREKYINIISKSGNRMLSTVNDIIEISKIETGQISISHSEININDMFMDYYNFFKPETDKKSLSLIFKSDIKSDSSDIITDNNMLDSILTNLIKNAIKYTNEGEIEFGVKFDNDRLEFYVKDTGIGIAEERHEAVFDRFIQADIEDKQAFEGSGLGLSIVKAYTDMLGGEIILESEPGRGSTFKIIIPVKLAKDDTSRNASYGVLEEKTETEKLNVLIVEDDSISEMHMSIILKDISKSIMVARTGLEAVEMCMENKDIDLILMDIKVPEINGYEAAKRIRKFNKKVKIIAQTAYAMPSDRENAKKAGCDEYITKPINKTNLIRIIGNLF